MVRIMPEILQKADKDGYIVWDFCNIHTTDDAPENIKKALKDWLDLKKEIE